MKRKKKKRLEKIVTHPKVRKTIKTSIYKDLIIGLASYGLVLHQTPTTTPTQNPNLPLSYTLTTPLIREENPLQEFSDYLSELKKQESV